MPFAMSFVPVLLACYVRLAESGRYQRQREYASSQPGLANIPLSSMLLAMPKSTSPQGTGRLLHTRTSSPKHMNVAELAPIQQNMGVQDRLAGEAPLGGGPQEGSEKMKALCDSAKVLSDLGLHDKAKQRYDLCQDVMDQGHRSLQSYRHKLKMKLRREGDNDANLIKSIFEFKQKKFGKGNPLTFKSQQNYADVLGDVGRHSEAAKMKSELLDLRSKELGAEHEDTLKTMGSYAQTLIALKRENEALALQKAALEIAERTLGPDHPDTIKASDDYSTTLMDMSPHVEAEPPRKKKVGVRVLKERQRVNNIESSGPTPKPVLSYA
jgi:hypothetical protein